MSSEIDSVSDSSTLVYDHEPFETFQARALKLCETALGAASGKTSIERMQGGGDAGERPALEQYILRIPRLEVSQLGRDLAPLQLLRQRSQIPIPEVIAFDTTTQNVSESPYMIQKRIPGVPLFPTYPNMPQQMKRVIAEELGKAYSELHSVRSVTAGRLTLSPSRDSLLVQPFDDTRTDAIVPYEDGPAAEATIDMLSSILTHKKELAGAEGPNRSWMIEFLDHFKTAASEMSALGVLDRSDYCLCHLDLEPRNILAQAPSSTQPQTVIGILDWDSAIFAPALLSCSPPMWLWAWNEEADEDERLAGDIPSTPELRELKELFEEAAGPTYRRFPYGAQYRLARQLFRFTIDGLHTNEDLMATELLLKEWGDVQKSLKLANDTTAEPQIACSVTNQ
ncbi:unnamed protein product [Penicillium bialowiezense]